MFIKLLKLSVIAILIANANVYALDPNSMFKDGKRAFDLANWEESREILTRFMETWPQHEKCSEALYFYTLASAKTIDSRTEEYRAELGKELSSAIASLSNDLPDKDISEAQAALKIAQNTNKPENWNDLEKLNPVELKHYLSRNWHPEAADYPFETIEWANKWLEKNSNIDSELKSDIALIKLSALWQIIRSPLIKESSEEKLKAIECFPIEPAFGRALNEAFRKGNPDQKRKAAIFGYHFDYFCANRLDTHKSIKSPWFRYLKSRGISPQDTWSPR